MGAAPRVADSKDDTRYVNGLTRYMNIQKRGRASGPARIPQNAYSMMKRIFDTEDASCALSIPAINMCAKELAKRKVAQMISTVNRLRVWTVSVYWAFRYNPTG